MSAFTERPMYWLIVDAVKRIQNATAIERPPYEAIITEAVRIAEQTDTPVDETFLSRLERAIDSATKNEQPQLAADGRRAYDTLAERTQPN